VGSCELLIFPELYYEMDEELVKNLQSGSEGRPMREV